MNEINMLKSVYFLYTQVPKKRFDMALWRANYKNRKADTTSPVCNTTGCVGGWLTTIVPKNKLIRYQDGDINFAETMISTLGLSGTRLLFLIYAGWYNVDNTPKGACKRFLYLLTTKNPDYGIRRNHPYTKIDIVSTYNKLKAKYEKSGKRKLVLDQIKKHPETWYQVRY